MFSSILPTVTESGRVLPGDDLIAAPTAVMDTGFDLPAPPNEVFPWFVQLGKQRGGWYLPRRVERAIPRGRRGAWTIEQRWQRLAVGDRIPDYGGRNGYLECVLFEPGRVIGYVSTRGRLTMTWVLTFRPVDGHTRVVIRLRIATQGSPRSVFVRLGAVFDRLTIAGLASGLQERLRSPVAVVERSDPRL